MGLELKNFHGGELEAHLDGLGALRIAVFREYPYLYDGSLDYERDYLRTYVNCPRSLVVLAFDAGRVVGATTCLPMVDEGPEFQAAFVKAGYDLGRICYFGESILLPEYRGLGYGKEFFRRREAHAASLGGIQWTVFCAVDRPENHPRRPVSYQPLDAFWRSQGYEKHSELQATVVWKEIEAPDETAKTLTYWMKPWN